MLGRDLAQPPQLRGVEAEDVLDTHRLQPDLRRGVALGRVHVWRLDPVPRVEGEAEALDPKERGHAVLLPLSRAP